MHLRTAVGGRGAARRGAAHKAREVDDMTPLGQRRAAPLARAARAPSLVLLAACACLALHLAPPGGRCDAAAPAGAPAALELELVPAARFEAVVLGVHAPALVVFAPFGSAADPGVPSATGEAEEKAREGKCARLGVALARLAKAAARGRVLAAAVDTSTEAGAATARRYAAVGGSYEAEAEAGMYLPAFCAEMTYFEGGDKRLGAAGGDADDTSDKMTGKDANDAGGEVGDEEGGHSYARGEAYDFASGGAARGGAHVARLVGWLAARAPRVRRLGAEQEMFAWLHAADGAGGTAARLPAAAGEEGEEIELDESHVPKVLALVDGGGDGGDGEAPANVRLAAGVFAPWLEFGFVDVGAAADLEAVRRLGGPLANATAGDLFATVIGDRQVHFIRGPPGVALRSAGISADGREDDDAWGVLFSFLRKVGVKLGLPPPGGRGTAEEFAASKAGGREALPKVEILSQLEAICGAPGDVCAVAIIGPKQFDDTGLCTPDLATTLLEVKARRGGAAVGYAYVDVKNYAPRLPSQLGLDMLEDLPRVLAVRLDSGEYAVSASYEPRDIMGAIDRAAAREVLATLEGGVPDFRIGAIDEEGEEANLGDDDLLREEL